jgi:hypothetical protein
VHSGLANLDSYGPLLSLAFLRHRGN